MNYIVFQLVQNIIQIHFKLKIYILEVKTVLHICEKNL